MNDADGIGLALRNRAPLFGSAFFFFRSTTGQLEATRTLINKTMTVLFYFILHKLICCCICRSVI
jgi:hypothetical protein